MEGFRKMIKWHLEKKLISELKNWEKNPRTISKKAFEELEKSVDDLGNFEPLVINIDGTVIAGNQRLRLEMKKGNSEVDVYVPERELSEEEVKKIGVISNRHSGDWDMDILANEFEDILKGLGFDDLLPELVMEVNEDDYEEPEQLPSKVQLGDVWQLGKHRLMCGDSTKIEDVEKLMNGQKADMVFTDPPYGVEYTGGQFYSGKPVKDRREQIANDDILIYKDSLLNASMFVDSGAFYVFYTSSFTEDVLRQLTEAGLERRAIIIWNKTNTGYGDLNSNYKNNYEPIFYGVKKGKPANWCGDTKQTTIWSIDKPKRNKLHSTMKPIELCAKGIQNSSKKNGIILDVFGGSGSTLIACEQTNRICYMMELDTHYSSVIIDRWETLTGKKAVKI